MRRLILSISLFLATVSGAVSQDQPDFNTINNETYRLYLAQEWDSLIRMGNEALRQGVDYYYLRMRMGIARYQKKNYRKAAVHFTRALGMNQDDPASLEYLYFCRLLAGNSDRANLVKKRFKGGLAHRIPPPKGKFIERISAEYLYGKGLNDDLLHDNEALFSGLTSGLQYLNRHYSNASLSLVNRIAPGFSLIHTYTFLSKINYQYYNNGLYPFELADHHLFQHQYYISPRIAAHSGLTVQPVLHLVNVRYQVPLLISQGYQGGASQVTLGYQSDLDVIAGIGLRQSIGCFDLSLEGYYSTLNSASQVQNRAGLTWFPLGNLSFYAGGYLNTQFERSNGEGIFRTIPELLLGFSIRNKVWFDLKAGIGEKTNYHEYQGMIVFNSFSEVIEKQAVISVSVPLSEKGSLLYLGGRWSYLRSEFYAFDQAQNAIDNAIHYHNVSIYGGLSWKF